MSNSALFLPFSITLVWSQSWSLQLFIACVNRLRSRSVLLSFMNQSRCILCSSVAQEHETSRFHAQPVSVPVLHSVPRGHKKEYEVRWSPRKNHHHLFNFCVKKRGTNHRRMTEHDKRSQWNTKLFFFAVKAFPQRSNRVQSRNGKQNRPGVVVLSRLLQRRTMLTHCTKLQFHADLRGQNYFLVDNNFHAKITIINWIYF